MKLSDIRFSRISEPEIQKDVFDNLDGLVEELKEYSKSSERIVSFVQYSYLISASLFERYKNIIDSDGDNYSKQADDCLTRSTYVCRLGIFDSYKYRADNAFISNLNPDFFTSLIELHILYSHVLRASWKFFEASDTLRVARRFFDTFSIRYSTSDGIDISKINDLEKRIVTSEFDVATNVMGLCPFMAPYMMEWEKHLKSAGFQYASMYDYRSDPEEMNKQFNGMRYYEDECEYDGSSEHLAYRKYCWDYNHLVSCFNVLYPYYYEKGAVPYRMMEDFFPLEFFKNQDSKSLMADIIQSFAHSRYLWFIDYNNTPVSHYPVQNVIDSDAHGYRGAAIEGLIDCYSRCYTILDKVAKVVQIEWGITLEKNKRAYFSEIFKKILRTSSLRSNVFLRNLALLYPDVNPALPTDGELKKRKKNNGEKPAYKSKYDYSMWPEIEHLDTIRNHIQHAGLVVTHVKVDAESKFVAYITEQDLLTQTDRLLSITKNAVLYLYGAIMIRKKD